MKKKTSLIIFRLLTVIFVFAAAMFVLNHSIGNAWRTTDYHPELSDSPVYVEFGPSTPLTANITPSESFSFNSIDVVLVNISGSSSGTLSTTITDSANNTISSSRDSLSGITVGGWHSLGLNGNLIADETYTISFSVDEGNPYFMSLDPSSGDSLPYELSVSGHGDSYISLGIERVDIVPQTFGDVFYYSIPLCVILFIFGIAWAILGSDLFIFIQKLPIDSAIHRYGNELFMVLTYIVLCVSIYFRAYVQSVYITSDSAGYLREAVNIINGNGYSYDGLAGYNTWFANWPILYPLMISIVMLTTRVNAYLASKILSMILLLIIMLVIYVYAKKDAWLYSLVLLNTGFISLLWATWSELPFMLFLLVFGIILGRIVNDGIDETKPIRILDLVLTGLFAFLIFMTRYYGLFVYFVMIGYVCIFFGQWIKTKRKASLHRWLGLTISGGVSGMLCLGYLLLNKIKNGMASGVARTMWWDDYGILTDDLITSLLTEFFHVFHLETPDFISSLPVYMQVWILFIILIGLAYLISRPLKKRNEHSVWIVMAIVYYVMFTVIRYFSSMDSFYYRFWEPATFLLTLGIIGYFISYLKETSKNKNVTHSRNLAVFGAVIGSLIMISGISLISENRKNQTASDDSHSYYVNLCDSWNKAYAEIPEQSVIIFSDMDFRSSWYRPDVVEGSIDPNMTMDDIRSTYYGSKYMCIKRTDAETMLDASVYPADVEAAIEKGLQETVSDTALQEAGKYIIIPLN